MPGTRVGVDQVKRLADAVHDKIMSKQEFLAEAVGPISIKVVPKGNGGFDINVTATT